MASARFQCLPTELLSIIFQCSDTSRDLLALITTCQRFHAVFQSQMGHILWSLGRRCMYAFDVALIAVRATKIVCDSLSASKLPSLRHLYPVQQLSGTKRLPTVDEFQKIVNLQHFGHCVEHLILLNAPRLQPACWFEPGVTVLQTAVGWERGDPQFPEMHRLWRSRLYRNIFRLMICGACLAAPYHEPFFYEGPEKPQRLLHRFVGTGRDQRISDTELEFLDQFPTYRAIYNHLPFFGDDIGALHPLADWLVEDMRQASDAEGDTFARYGEKLGQWPIVMQVLHCLWTLEELDTIIATPRGLRGTGKGFVSPKLTRHNARYSNRDNEEGSQPLRFGETRTITTVLHGIHQPEDITMPVRPGDQISLSGVYTRHNLISTTPSKRLGKPMTPTCEGSRQPKQIKLSGLHQHLWATSPFLVPAAGGPINPFSTPGSVGHQVRPEHRLFAYILQEDGGLSPSASSRLFWETSLAWRGVVSILAFRHSKEVGFELIVRRLLS